MAVENLKSTAVTNLDTIPRVPNTAGVGAPVALKTVNDYVTISASASTTSTYQMVRIPSTAKVKNVMIESEAQGAGKVDVGLYYSSATTDSTAPANQGTVIDQDFFASDVDLASLVTPTNITNESTTYTLAKRNQPIWQAVGLSSDPGGMFDVVLTVHTTAITTGTGKTGLQVSYAE